MLLQEIVLVIQKFIVMSEKYVSWHGIKTDILRISYSIFIILIPKSVLVFFTFASTSFDDTDFARLYLVRNLPTSILVRASVSLLTFHSVSLLTFHLGAILVYEFRVLQRRFQKLSISTLIPPFHIPRITFPFP